MTIQPLQLLSRHPVEGQISGPVMHKLRVSFGGLLGELVILSSGWLSR